MISQIRSIHGLIEKARVYLTRFGYVAQSLFKDSAEILNSAKQSFGEVRPGDVKYKDLNGDGVIDAYDQTAIGTGDVPFILYGFGFDLTYQTGLAWVHFSRARPKPI